MIERGTVPERCKFYNLHSLGNGYGCQVGAAVKRIRSNPLEVLTQFNIVQGTAILKGLVSDFLQSLRTHYRVNIFSAEYPVRNAYNALRYCQITLGAIVCGQHAVLNYVVDAVVIEHICSIPVHTAVVCRTIQRDSCCTGRVVLSINLRHLFIAFPGLANHIVSLAIGIIQNNSLIVRLHHNHGMVIAAAGLDDIPKLCLGKQRLDILDSNCLSSFQLSD